MNSLAPQTTISARELRASPDPGQLLRDLLVFVDEVVIDAGGYKLHVLGTAYLLYRKRRAFKTFNPQTKRSGVRTIEDITRAMRDRTKLKTLDLMRHLNQDDTPTVVALNNY